MDLSTISVSDFKAYFYRDFAYLPLWNNTQLYNKNARVYYDITLLFYDCQANGITGNVPADTYPWLNTESAQADSTYNYVQDADITKAFAQAKINLNQALFSSDDNIRIGYLWLVAHYLCIDLRAANGGIAAVGSFPVTSKSVGSVAEAYGIPEAYMKNPLFAQFAQTAYGMKFLSLIMPNLAGNVVAVAGITHP